MASHFVLYLGLLSIALGVPRGLLFAIVQTVVSGWYLNVIFGTNHTAMPLLSQSQRMGFVEQQVTTSRNVRVPGCLSFLFGGLDLQIEHHLFPTMPRNQLRRARAATKAFCAKHGVSYRESGFAETYLEIFRHMWRVSRLVKAGCPLSAGRPAASAYWGWILRRSNIHLSPPMKRPRPRNPNSNPTSGSMQGAWPPGDGAS